MNIQEEIRIIREQMCIMSDTAEGKLIRAIESDFTADDCTPSGRVYYLMSIAYSAGVVQGKRIERSKRKKVI